VVKEAGVISAISWRPVLVVAEAGVPYFSYIMETSFSGGGSRSTRREPPTMGKQLVNFITCSCESAISWRAVLVVEEAGVPGENNRPMGKQLVNFITCGCESSAPHGSWEATGKLYHLRLRVECTLLTGKLYHLRLRVKCTLFVIYKAGRESTPYW